MSASTISAAFPSRISRSLAEQDARALDGVPDCPISMNTVHEQHNGRNLRQVLFLRRLLASVTANYSHARSGEPLSVYSVYVTAFPS